jgi:hypothetical protein
MFSRTLVGCLAYLMLKTTGLEDGYRRFGRTRCALRNQQALSEKAVGIRNAYWSVSLCCGHIIHVFLLVTPETNTGMRIS